MGMQYTIGELLSSDSGFALVHEGYDNFGNLIAIKIFKPANKKFTVVKSQWEKETNILRRIQHQNVIAIYDAFICDNLFYIIFERAWGDIYHLIQKFGAQNELAVKEITRQLLVGLNYIHRNQILHKDLTVYNVLVFLSTNPATYKISDFGISEDFIDSKSVSTNPTAHRHFKPPELVNYGYTNRQSDLYHLGLILLFCHTGKFPYNLNLLQVDIDKAIKNGEPRKMAESIGTPFGQFISMLLRRREQYRFHEAVDAWNCLKKI